MEPVLGEVIATGGMGSVHDGRLDGVPVAVKVLSREHAGEPAFVRAFRTEARAMATLAHPDIVAVLDIGRFERGPLAGCPYVVMERAEGNLADACGRHPWSWVRQRLLAILAGLAHAHARGITHRDLKPANVLTAGDRLLLADFGLARAFEAVDASSREQPAGTPGYMPDEQRHGRWRDVGPWTDLYALGKLALDLVATPDGRSIQVPVGFDRWISRLRQPTPAARYQRAADAAAGLRSLPEAATETLSDLAGLGPMVDSTLARTQPYFADEDALQPALPDPLPLLAVEVPETPLPVHDRGRRPRLSLDLLRSSLPEHLESLASEAWATVRRAHHGSTEVLQWVGEEDAVHALAMWLCHQLHATGAGTVNLATHDRHRRPESGISGWIARETRCLDLESRPALERLRGSIHRPDAEALVDLMAPISTGQLSTADRLDRFATLERHLQRDAGERLPFLWIERGQHADAVLDFLRWRSQRPGRLLAVVTTDAPVDVPGAVVHVPAPATDPLVARLLEEEGTADVEAAWRHRLAPLLDLVQTREPLVMAAVLGDRVRSRNWTDALRRARIELPTGLLERVIDLGVAVPVGLGGDAWRFTSRRVRRQVLEAAGDQLAELHLAALRTYPVAPATALIRAHHARCAGDPARAREILLDALPLASEHDPWVTAELNRVLT